MCEICKHHCWVGINYCPKCGRKVNRMSDNLDKIITNVIEAEKNGVKIIIKQQYDREINDINIDFSEHDKKFNDKIASLKKQIEKLESIRTRCHESARDCFDSGNYGCLHIVTADELKTTKDVNDRTIELPFDALETANMLINATYKAEIPFLEKQVDRNVYDIDDLEQIAEHLLVYCKHNKEV